MGAMTLRKALAGGGLSTGRRLLLALLALILAAAAWLPAVHLFFAPAAGQFRAEQSIAPRARQVATRHLALWADSKARQRELDRMRSSNAEWDFMGRTFLVLALSNMALREPGAAARYLALTDQIIDQTLLLERQEGIYFFLMDYARARPFVVQPARSLFVDGEIALMLAARCLVRDKPAYRAELRRRVALMVRQMRRSPVRCGESYPDECWTFCNSVAVAAIHLSDLLEGRPRAHQGFIQAWLERAKRQLVDAKTGILLSSYRLDGSPKDGPEGSSIWLAAHCLQLVDPALARDQYRRARAELGRTVLGFGYAREWPVGQVGPADIDSGPIVPLLEASAGSSGLALLGAAAFDDRGYFDALCATLELAGFPAVTNAGGVRYAASNQVGDAVMLYAMVQGPLWARARALGAPKVQVEGATP
jgi:hypothetical protein